MIFDDEFDGSSLGSTWQKGYWYQNDGGVAAYTSDQVTVGDGALKIRSERKAVDGKQYVTGMATTHDSFHFKYGVYEVRAKAARGKGVLSAAWTMPTSGAWPPEIDNVEILGGTPHMAVTTYHYLDDANKPQASGDYFNGPDYTVGYHLFTVDWEPGVITWYIDGVARKTYRSSTVTDKDMFLILSQHVGAPGDWQDTPDAGTPFPADFDVDYVRVWQRS